MTLIIGIKSSDGIVIGADSAATISTPTGQPTVKQDVKKLEIISSNIIIGNSGQVGFCQKLKDELNIRIQEPKKDIRKINDKNKLKRELQEILLRINEKDIEIGQKFNPIFPNLVKSNLTNHLLIALPFINRPILLQFTITFNIEEAEIGIPFASAGVIQPLADTFLAFIRSIFWEEKELPSFQMSIFSLIWTLDFCTKIAPGYVCGPFQVIELREKSGNCVAREIPNEELEEHYESINSLLTRFKEYKNDFFKIDEEVRKAIPQKPDTIK